MEHLNLTQQNPHKIPTKSMKVPQPRRRFETDVDLCQDRQDLSGSVEAPLRTKTMEPEDPGKLPTFTGNSCTKMNLRLV